MTRTRFPLCVLLGLLLSLLSSLGDLVLDLLALIGSSTLACLCIHVNEIQTT